MKKFVMIVMILFGLLNVTGCQGEEKDKKENKENSDGVILNEYNVKDLSLDVKKIVVDEDALASFKEKNSGENVTKDYVVQILLDKLYPVSQKDIDQLLAKEKKNYQNWEEYLESNNLTDKTYGIQLKYREQIKLLVTDSLVINDEVLKEYYDAIFTTNTTNIQHLLVNDKETAEKLYQKLEKGNDFAKLAKEFSLDTTTKEKGGVWNDYRPGTSLEIIDEEISNLTDVGQVSQPFNSILGWHIVKLQALNNAKPFKDMKDTVKEQYIESKMTFNYIKVLIDQIIEKNMNHFDKNIQKELKKEDVSSNAQPKKSETTTYT